MHQREWKKACQVDRLEARTLMSGELSGAGAVSMAYDGVGTLHVAYYDTAATNLKYMTRSADGTWSPAVTADAAPAVGAQLALAVDSTGRPGIAYYDETNGDLKYARLADGGNWDVRTVEFRGNTGLNPSLAFNRANQPLISYYSATRQDLRLGWMTGSRWRTRAIATRGSVGRFSSIAVSPTDGSSRIAYESASKRRVMLARQRGGGVVVATLAAAPEWASRPSLAFNAAGEPSVSYSDPAQNRLVLSTQVRSPKGRLTWNHATVASGPVPASTLRFDPASGQPLLVYTSGGNVMLASGGANGWASTTLGPGTSAAAALGGESDRLSVLSGNNLLDVGTSLKQPAAVFATIAPLGVELSWQDQSQVESGFVVERSTDGGPWATLVTTAPNTVQYTDSSATAGSTYQYRVLTTSGGGTSEPTNVVSAAPASGAPQAPANVVTTPVSDTEINLTWDRVGTGEEFITILRSTDGGPYAVLTSLPAGSNIFTDTSGYPDTAYSYRLSTGNAAGSSLPTAALSATTKPSGATLPAASGLTAIATSPFAISLNWSDPSSGYRNWLVERSSNGVAYEIVAVLAGSNTTATYTDTPLTPSTTYYYRIRQASGAGYGDYTNPASTTTEARPAAAPVEPTGFSATVNSASSATLAWDDTNGGSSGYVIETAPFSWTGKLAWTAAAITPAGATTHTLTTTAETFYYVRIRARNAAGDSGSTAKIVVRTASPGTGSPKVYEIGPGKAYTSLAALDWSQLGPGDTVNIYPNKDGSGTIIPYYEKPLISVRGTAAAPVRIVGIADPVTGDLPIIDGTNAVAHAQWNRAYLPFGDTSLVLIATRSDQTSTGWSPGYLSISNLEIRNGYAGDTGTTPLTYTAYDGSTRAYAPSASGIYIEKGDHIEVKGSVIHGNNQGIFAAGQSDQRNVEALTLDSNQFYNNGTIGSDRQHTTYIEGINTTYNGNRYGSLRKGASGSGLKDRGAGTVIRYNSVEGYGHLLDLVEAENYFKTVLTLSRYQRTDVYGNVFYNRTASTPIHYGGDGGVRPLYRKGVLRFYNNTFVNHMDRSDRWRINVFKLSSSGESLDARNNIIHSRPFATQTASELNLISTNGVAYFGRNWVSPGWNVSQPGVTYTGNIAGTGNLIGNDQNDPGFIDFGARDFRLSAATQCLDQAWAIQANAFEVLYQPGAFTGPTTVDERVVTGQAPDLGAYEYGG